LHAGIVIVARANVRRLVAVALGVVATSNAVLLVLRRRLADRASDAR